jgi:hypothetical protein
MDWKKLISQSVGSEQLGDINNFVSISPITKDSAIDIFYTESRKIILNTPNDTDPNEWTGAANLVVLLSLTENYFRTILGNILKICPVAKKNAAENNINFGSVLWHPDNTVERGAFEHVSFSESKKIIEVTRKYIGVDLNQSDLTPILDEFGKVCELRHSIVHSGKYLAGKNALMLNVSPSINFIKISIGYAQLQNAATICTTLVVSYNQLMFETLCKRWAIQWRQLSLCTPASENSLMKSIWRMFYSKIDFDEGNVLETGTWVKCRNLLKIEFNIR